MDIRNWEFFAGTGAAVVGANVGVYVASLTHPNPNSATSTTTTNSDGMWEFTGLSDANTYDVKVEYSGRVKWYKGLTKHNITHLYDDEVPDPNRNLIPNGGCDLTEFLDTNGSQALPAADPGIGTTNGADFWIVYGGAGDSGTISKELTQKSVNSKASMKVAYNRAGGANQCRASRHLPDSIWQQLKGKQVTLSVQVYQETTSSELAAYIDDGVGVTTGTVTSTVGSWVTVSVTRTISASATQVRPGVVTARAGTGNLNFYVDNAILDFGSVAPVFAPDLSDRVTKTALETIVDSSAPSTATAGNVSPVYVLLSNLANRIKAATGAADWRANPVTTIAAIKTAADALAASVTAGLALKVAKAGDTMTGDLAINRTGIGAPTTGYVFLGNGGNYVGFDSASLVFSGLAIWHAGNMAAQATLLARANHTGTQAPATISPQGAGSTLDADTVDGKHALDLSPLGMVAWFATLAELTAAGASWQRYTAADGRLLVGAGASASAQTFTEATDYGSSWTPATGVSVSDTIGISDTVSWSSGAIAATAGPFVNQGTGTLNATNFNHTHPAPTLSKSGSVTKTGSAAIAGTSTVWLPYMRAGIWGRRI